MLAAAAEACSRRLQHQQWPWQPWQRCVVCGSGVAVVGRVACSKAAVLQCRSAGCSQGRGQSGFPGVRDEEV
jgi:hypothetical protein